MLRRVVSLRFPIRRSFSSPPAEDAVTACVRSVGSQLRVTDAPRLRALLDLLLVEHSAAEQRVVPLLTKHPSTAVAADPDVWVKLLNQLRKIGLEAVDILSMVCETPTLLTTPPEHFASAIQALRHVGFPERKLVPLVRRCPQLLQIQPKHLIDRIQQLKSIFTRGDVIRLVQRCPNLFFEDWDETEKKIQYILFRMGAGQVAILHSRVLSHSLRHIWQRHECASRAGVYHTPDPKHPLKTQRQPLLRHLTDTTDAVFAGQIVGISQSEFYTFIKVLDAEGVGPFPVDEEESDDD